MMYIKKNNVNLPFETPIEKEAFRGHTRNNVKFSVSKG